jgi:hypothetical protein
VPVELRARAVEAPLSRHWGVRRADRVARPRLARSAPDAESAGCVVSPFPGSVASADLGSRGWRSCVRDASGWALTKGAIARARDRTRQGIARGAARREAARRGLRTLGGGSTRRAAMRTIQRERGIVLSPVHRARREVGCSPSAACGTHGEIGKREGMSEERTDVSRPPLALSIAWTLPIPRVIDANAW